MRQCVAMFPDGMKAEKLNARNVTAAFAAWDATGGKKNGRIRRFKTLMRWAYKMDYISSAAWLDKLPVYPDETKKAKRLEKYLEKDELESVIAAAAVPEYKTLISFLALSGLRIGEAIALTPSDISDVITVNKTYSAVTGEIGPTKTDGSTREVFIQKELAAVLKDVTPGKKYYFTRNGHQIEYYAFNKYFSELTARTIGRRLSTHALRHTHVSLLAAAGVPLDIISRRLGHANSKITREIYFHVTNEMKDRDRQVLDRLRLL